MHGMSLLDVLRGVMLDPAEQAAYNADPGAYLERYGYDDVDPADLSEAFGLVADTLPPDVAQAAWQAAAEPDNGSFGAVTPDFDTEGGGAGIAVAPEVEAEGPAPVEPEPASAPEPALSFGQGEAGNGDVEATLTGPAPEVPDVADGGDRFGDTVLEDTSAGGDPGGAPSGEDDDEAPADEDAYDESPGDDDFGEASPGQDDHVEDPLGADDLGGVGVDDMDDLGQIEGLGELDDPGPDDTDIGSF
jgi:hypothetical protein